MGTRTAEASAAALADLVDVLIPGDADFPRASAIGLHQVVAARVGERAGDTGVDDLLDALEAGQGPWSRFDPEARVRAVARLERDAPAQFGLLKAAAYLGYYEHPAVQAVIRAMGFRYNAAALPAGYDVGRFNPVTDTPDHRRGGYVATADVRRVDLAGLGFLADHDG